MIVQIWVRRSCVRVSQVLCLCLVRLGWRPKPFLDPWDVVGLRTTASVWNVPVEYVPHGELFFFHIKKEPFVLTKAVELRPCVTVETLKACALIGFAFDRRRSYFLVLQCHFSRVGRRVEVCRSKVSRTSTGDCCLFLLATQKKTKSRLPMHWFGWLASLGDSSVMLWRVLSFWGCWSCCVCRVFSCVFVRGVLGCCALSSVVGFVCVRDVGVLSLCTFKSLFCWASDWV